MKAHIFLAATKQLYEWFGPAPCLPFYLSHLFNNDHVALSG